MRPKRERLAMVSVGFLVWPEAVFFLAERGTGRTDSGGTAGEAGRVVFLERVEFFLALLEAFEELERGFFLAGIAGVFKTGN